MNKYKEALWSIDFTMHNRVKPKYLQNVEDKNFEILYELVEKATPKKLHKKYINLQGYYHFNFECPNCYSLICYDTATIYEKIGYRYCKICGQALEWSEEDE